MSQLILRRGDGALALQLIQTYFKLFDIALKADGERRSQPGHRPEQGL